jgi:hypothetical protein
MAEPGGLRIGVDIIEPKTPPLEIVNTAPVSSESSSTLLRARCESAIQLDLGHAQMVGVAQHRHHEAALGATAIPMS